MLRKQTASVNILFLFYTTETWYTFECNLEFSNMQIWYRPNYYDSSDGFRYIDLPIHPIRNGSMKARKVEAIRAGLQNASKR